MGVVGSRRPIVTALAPGAHVGRYELIQGVAVGGMAEIYLARTQGPQRFEKYVILKRILPHLAAEPSFVDMFLDEARLAASMSHSNIVQVHDFGEADGSYFFTMEYVHGEDVRAILKTCRKHGRRLSIGDTLTIISGAAAGLHYAHELEENGHPLGVVHRDVSPSNILVTFDGTVKVTDFGIAKATQRAVSTRSGTVKGKVSYMSPEQCEGAALDRRADVFALSIVLYELTTGHKLFGGENDLAIMRRIIDEDVRPPSTIVPDYPPALEAIVMRGLARSRDARHASTLELQTDLEQFCRSSGHVVSAPSLARTMIELFGKRPHPWTGQRQPSVISMDTSAADWDIDSKPTTLVPGNSATSMSAAAGEAGAVPVRSKRPLAMIGVAAICAVALGLAIFVKARGGDDAPGDTTPMATPAPSPPITPPAPSAPPPIEAEAEPILKLPPPQPTFPDPPPQPAPDVATGSNAAPVKTKSPAKSPVLKRPKPRPKVKPTTQRDIDSPFLPD